MLSSTYTPGQKWSAGGLRSGNSGLYFGFASSLLQEFTPSSFFEKRVKKTAAPHADRLFGGAEVLENEAPEGAAAGFGPGVFFEEDGGVDGVVGAVVGVLGLLVQGAGLGVLDERLGVEVGSLLAVEDGAHLREAACVSKQV